jgi:hypothetical protein
MLGGRNLGDILVTGLMSEFGPGIFEGMISEYIAKLHIKDTVAWVQADKSLWDNLPQSYKDKIKIYGPRLGKLTWFTYDWLYNITLKYNPALASAFLTWEQGQDWLKDQVELIKSQIL